MGVSADPVDGSSTFKHNKLDTQMLLHGAPTASGHRNFYFLSEGSPEGFNGHVISLLLTGGHKLIIVNWLYTPSLSKHT